MIQVKSTMPSDKPTKWGRLVLQMVVGACVGGAVTAATLVLIKSNLAVFDDPQRLVAMGVGLIFLMMGAFVALGTALPRPGSLLLNVEDADELRERSPDFRKSALTCGLVGILFLVLSVTASADAPGLLGRDAGSAIAAIAFIALAIIGFAIRNMGDELDKALAREASALAMHASLILFGGWGILAFLGHVDFVGPLGLAAGMTAMYLAAIMWVIGRRGLMTR